MPRGYLARSVGFTARRIPALRRVPVLKLLVVAELLLLAGDHLMWLTRQERRRLLVLVRRGRGRRRNLSEAERAELAMLIAKMEPRMLAGDAVRKLSPVPLPRRVLYGPRRRA